MATVKPMSLTVMLSGELTYIAMVEPEVKIRVSVPNASRVVVQPAFGVSVPLIAAGAVPHSRSPDKSSPSATA